MVQFRNIRVIKEAGRKGKFRKIFLTLLLVTLIFGTALLCRWHLPNIFHSQSITALLYPSWTPSTIAPVTQPASDLQYFGNNCSDYKVSALPKSIGTGGTCDRIPTVFCDNAQCDYAYKSVQRTVLCEIYSSLNSLHSFDNSNNTSDSPPCQLKQVTLTCDMLKQSSLPCSRNFVYHEIDYHGQFHCLSQIAKSVSTSSSSKVPPLHHQVWFFDHSKELEFYEYIALISHMRFFKPKAVFIWNYGNLPKNRWWQEFISQLNQPAEQTELLMNVSYQNSGNQIISRKVFFFQTQLYSVLRKPPSHIYGRPIKFIQHKSDVARLEAVLLFGGFYADVDTISLRSHAPLLNYSVTMGLEDSTKLTNMGIFGEPHAPHLYNWHSSYINFDQESWGEFSLERNLRMAKRCPQYVNIEVETMVWPTWSNRQLFYTSDMNISASYTVHLFWRYISHTNLTDPSELQAPRYLVHRIFRGIYYGTCEVCG